MPSRSLKSRVHLRPLERSDLNEEYLGWLNNPEVTRFTETGMFPTTIHDLEKFYADVTGSRNQIIFAVVDDESGKHIGNVKLGPIHWVYRRATLGILIGNRDFWGKGLCIETTRLAVEYGFYRLNLRRIDLAVCADHESAVRCYEKAGFKIEGRLRQDYFCLGAYRDRLWMGLLRSEYEPSPVKERASHSEAG